MPSGCHRFGCESSFCSTCLGSEVRISRATPLYLDESATANRPRFSPIIKRDYPPRRRTALLDCPIVSRHRRVAHRSTATRTSAVLPLCFVTTPLGQPPTQRFKSPLRSGWYVTSIILTLIKLPPGAGQAISSPSLRPNRALPTGARMDTLSLEPSASFG